MFVGLGPCAAPRGAAAHRHFSHVCCLQQRPRMPPRGLSPRPAHLVEVQAHDWLLTSLILEAPSPTPHCSLADAQAHDLGPMLSSPSEHRALSACPTADSLRCRPSPAPPPPHNRAPPTAPRPAAHLLRCRRTSVAISALQGTARLELLAARQPSTPESISVDWSLAPAHSLATSAGGAGAGRGRCGRCDEVAARMLEDGRQGRPAAHK